MVTKHGELSTLSAMDSFADYSHKKCQLDMLIEMLKSAGAQF